MSPDKLYALAVLGGFLAAVFALLALLEATVLSGAALNGFTVTAVVLLVVTGGLAYLYEKEMK